MSILDYLLQYNRYMNLIGIVAILCIASLFSQKRDKINVRLIFSALIIQFCIAAFVLRTWIGHTMVSYIAAGVTKIYEFADQGSAFVFGNLINPAGPWGFVFAFKVLPVIIFFGALMSLLFYLGIVQLLVQAISKIIRPLLGTSGAETLCAISNSFLGQTEAPLLIKNYLKRMTKSETLVVMVSGMGTISGAILVVFASMGVPVTHLLAASVMSIPSTIMIAKILLPETEKSKTQAGAEVEFEKKGKNVLDAISIGTTDGLYLALNVAAMLIAFVALLSLFSYLISYSCYQLNYIFLYLGVAFRLPELTLGDLFGYLFAPFGYLLGFAGEQALIVGKLLGIKVTANEFIAYGDLVQMNLPERTVNIVTYALCGFANFSCIGIQIGGIGALVPEKRKWLTELGLYAVLGGSLSNLLCAMVAALLL